MKPAVTFLCALCVLCGSSSASPSRPNIVLILADDLGWADLPAYGNRCVNSKYDAVKQLGIQPKPNPTRDRACAKAQRLLEEAIKSSSHENTKP